MKARDIIPGWPRGRSTLAPVSFLRAFMRWPSFMEIYAWEYIGDPRFTEDLEAERAEEKRKADMMEAYYEMQRIEARGPLYAESIVEKGFRTYLLAMRLHQ